MTSRIYVPYRVYAFNFYFISQFFDQKSLHPVFQVSGYCKTTCSTLKYSDSVVSNIFVFKNGSIIFWNIQKETARRLLKNLTVFNRLSSSETNDEEETLFFDEEQQNSNSLPKYGTFNEQGILILPSNLQSPENFLSKFAVSHALSESTQLGVYEHQLSAECDRHLEKILEEKHENIIASFFKPRVNYAEKLTEIDNKILILTLQNAIGDSQKDAYWDREELEKIYLSVREFLEIDSRFKLWNEQAITLQNAYKNHHDQNDARYGHNLEWMIIILISVEILITLNEHGYSEKSPFMSIDENETSFPF